MRYVERTRKREASGYSLKDFINVLYNYKRFDYVDTGRFSDARDKVLIEFVGNFSGDLLDSDGNLNERAFSKVEMIRVTTMGNVNTVSIIYADSFKLFTVGNDQISILGDNAQIFIVLK